MHDLQVVSHFLLRRVWLPSTQSISPIFTTHTPGTSGRVDERLCLENCAFINGNRLSRPGSTNTNTHAQAHRVRASKKENYFQTGSFSRWSVNGHPHTHSEEREMAKSKIFRRSNQRLRFAGRAESERESESARMCEGVCLSIKKKRERAGRWPLSGSESELAAVAVAPPQAIGTHTHKGLAALRSVFDSCYRHLHHHHHHHRHHHHLHHSYRPTCELEIISTLTAIAFIATNSNPKLLAPILYSSAARLARITEPIHEYICDTHAARVQHTRPVCIHSSVKHL